MSSGRGILTFCPDGYILDAQSSNRWKGVPEQLDKWLGGSVFHKRSRVTDIFCAAHGQDQDFFCTWTDKKAHRLKLYSLDNYPELKEYLDAGFKKDRFDHEAFHCSLGPDGAFYINNTGSTGWADGLDAKLRAELSRRMSRGEQYVDDPKQVALGVEGSYVLVGQKGDVFWDLKGHYEDLDVKLMASTKAVANVVLSPLDGDHWYILWSDDSTDCNVPKDWNVARD